MNSFFKQSPFFRLFLFALLGVVCAQYFQIREVVLFALLLGGILVLFVLYFWGRSLRLDSYWGITFHILCAFTGFLLAQQSLPLSIVEDYPKYSTYVVLTTKEEGTNGPYNRYEGELFSVNDQILDEKGLKVRFMVDTSDSLFRAGEMLYGKGFLKRIDPPANPGDFDYKTWANRRGIYYTTYCKKGALTSIGYHDPPRIQQVVRDIRFWLTAQFEKCGIVGDELAILIALTTGDKASIDSDLRASFATAGLMHVLAVSGLHIGIIYLILCWLVKPLEFYKHGKLLRMSIIVGALWLYAFFTGMSPSVSRAVLMFSFVVIGETSGRRYASENALFASAFLLMIFNPNIIFEAGFQLSYLAVFGIFRLYKPIYDWFYLKNRIADKIWSLCALSIAAQLATTPLSLYYFNQFPTYFLMGNLLIVPLVGFVIQGAVLFLAVSFYSPVSDFIGLIVNYILKIMTGYSDWVSTLPFSLISSIYTDLLTVFLLYLLVILVYSMFKTHRVTFVFATSTLILTLFIYGGIKSFKALDRYEIHAFDSYKSPILIVDSNTAFAFLPDTSVCAQTFVDKLSMFYKTPLTLAYSHVSVDALSVFSYQNIKILYGIGSAVNFSDVQKGDYDIIAGDSPSIEALRTTEALVLNTKGGYAKYDLQRFN